MSIWAVVVARAGPAAKTRLQPALRPLDRRRLALAMLSDVLAVCGAPPFDGCVAVVDTPLAERLARQVTPHTLREPGGMNQAVELGLRMAADHGARTTIVLPGDVPLLSGADIDRLLRAAGAAERVVIVASSVDGQGTNALLLRPPDVIAPSFGPPSVERHVRAGRSAGAHAAVCAGLDLALDVDTPDDLAALRARRPTGRTGALLIRLEQQALVGP